MNKLGKLVIVALVFVYFIAPVDACVGPIDDLLVVLLGIAGSKALSSRD